MAEATTPIRSALLWLGRQISNHKNPAAYLDPLLGAINPMLERSHTPAQVLAVEEAARDTKTFVLRPARHWRGFRAGQHVSIKVEIDGVLHTRPFSLSSSPETWESHDRVTLTIKRMPGGLVTNWMHDNIKPDDIISLGEAFGDFVLPPNPKPLLYIAGGSGITPILSQLETLYWQNYYSPITLLYYVRSQADVIGAQLLHDLRQHWPALDLQIFTEDRDGRMAASHLEALGDLSRHQCYLCGPPGMMDVANDLLDQVGVQESQIRSTFFSVPKASLDTDELGGDITFERSGAQGASDGETSVLEAAEAAGLTPKHGCRMGVCHQCSCTKSEGIVINRLTGKASGPGEETIQPCISVPRGAVSIKL